MGDGSLWAWGMNNVGQLGTFDLVDRHTPARLPSIYGIVAIAAGAFHNYGINEEGRVRSWGWNAFGQLGNPSASVTSGGLEVWDVDDVATIASGWYHGLAIKHDGSVVTWGWNVLGQLGDGTTVDRNTARPVNVPPAIAVAGGALHSLAA
jgi:alpha-tubulin suppressor-like RCC1 family protein